MSWEEIHHRLLEGLQAELRNRWGRVAEVEERLECSEGYLRKLCTGRKEFKLDLFLRSIEAMDLDPRAFFSRTLGLQPTPEDFLAELEDSENRDPAFTRMARVTQELESSEAPKSHAGATADASDVESFLQCTRSEQLRRLRQTIRYRTHAFAGAYLERLDSLRYDDAVMAAHLARGAAVCLIPALPGPQSDRLSLQSLALGIFGSARRMKGEYATAARAFRLALGVSRRAQLRKDTARHLQRASYLLRDVGHFERALALVNEAVVTYLRLGSLVDVGMALVDRGMMCTALGEFEEAVTDLEGALKHLTGTSARTSRNKLAAFQFLAYAHEQLGDLDAAEACLHNGMEVFGSEHAVDQAKLEWSSGTLAFRRGAFERSEELLRRAGKVLAARENPGQEALVSLDLVAALLAQGKYESASDLASSMAHLLMKLENTRLTEAAIVELLTANMEGKLNQEIVRQVRSKIRSEQGLPHASVQKPSR